MKKILLLLMCLLGKYVSAQYFMHTYGNAATNELNAQFVPCSDVNQGYMMAGMMSTAAGNLVNMVRPDNNGLIPAAPNFNNVYIISDPNTGVLWSSWATTVAEINVGGGVFDYAVGGVTINPGTTLPELLIMRINAAGAVLYVKSFTLTNYSLKDPKLKMALNGIDILVTGRCATGGNPQDVYVFSINSNTGVANWGFAYDMVMGGSLDDAGRDIIENPYAPAANPEIIVVGQSSGDGLFFKINALTGASIAGTAVRYNVTTRQELVSIKVSTNPLVMNNTAFVVAGNIDFGPWNAWTMLIDQTGVITWSTDHDSNNPGIQNTCNEIMERINTAAIYEYYTVGTMVQATNDIQVLKIGNNGMLVANGEFIYGLPTDQEDGMSVGFSNTAGFTISGYTDNGTGNYDQLLINAYFNGVTQCNGSIKNFTSNVNNPNITNPAITDNGPNTDYTLTSGNNTLGDNQICFANVVTGGNNAFSARKPKQDLFNFDIAANGTSGMNTGSPVTLKLANNHSDNIKAYMIDMMGRSIACKITYSGSGNDWQLTSSGSMAPGLYYITLSDGVERSTKTYLVK